jgi:Domain of unknown function DUF29
MVSEIQAATTNAGVRAKGGMTPDLLTLPKPCGRLCREFGASYFFGLTSLSTIRAGATMAESKLAETDPALSLYERDFFHWTELMSARLRDRETGDLDWDHLAEEIKDLGRRDRRELKNRLRVLIAHLLKWEYQPELREGSSWKSTIREQRGQIGDLLEDSPSLKPHIREAWAQVYRQAAELAHDEMKTEKPLVPKTCPYSQSQVLDPDFFPE